MIKAATATFAKIRNITGIIKQNTMESVNKNALTPKTQVLASYTP